MTEDLKIHASDCAVHNMPAFPNGPCDCEAANLVTDARAKILERANRWPASTMCTSLGVTYGELIDALAASPVQPSLETMLADPNMVHINMLRGGIAKLTPAQIGHLYRGDEAKAVIDEVTRQNPDAVQPSHAGEREREALKLVREMLAIGSDRSLILSHIDDALRTNPEGEG